MNKKIRLYAEISLGTILISAAFYFFFLPANLVTGGVMGISIILQNHFSISPSIFLYFANGMLLLIGFLFLGKDFFVKTVYASLLSPTVVLLFERVFMFDSEYFIRHANIPFLVAATVGSLITATGLGLCFKNNATTGGMDVIQKILVKYLKVPYSKTMYLTDFVVILLGGIIILDGGSIAYNFEVVVFGFLAVVIVGYIVDYIALNARSRRTAHIITTKPEEVRDYIYQTIYRGVTIVDVQGGYTKEQKYMLICTLDKNEWYKINNELYAVDPELFAYISSTKEVGGYYASKNRKES